MSYLRSIVLFIFAAPLIVFGSTSAIAEEECLAAFFSSISYGPSDELFSNYANQKYLTSIAHLNGRNDHILGGAALIDARAKIYITAAHVLCESIDEYNGCTNETAFARFRSDLSDSKKSNQVKRLILSNLRGTNARYLYGNFKFLDLDVHPKFDLAVIRAEDNSSMKNYALKSFDIAFSLSGHEARKMGIARFANLDETWKKLQGAYANDLKRGGASTFESLPCNQSSDGEEVSRNPSSDCFGRWLARRLVTLKWSHGAASLGATNEIESAQIRVVQGDSGGPIIQDNGMLVGIVQANQAGDLIGISANTFLKDRWLLDAVDKFGSASGESSKSLLVRFKKLGSDYAQWARAFDPENCYDFCITNLDMMRLADLVRGNPTLRKEFDELLACPIKLAAQARFAYDDTPIEEVLLQGPQKKGVRLDWQMPTGDYFNQRFSELSQITKFNVGKLQVAWTFSTGVLRGHEGNPLVVGDVMYVHTPFPNKVFALDLNDNGAVIWSYEPKQDPEVIPVMCCDTVNRGPAYADGKIFLHQADTTLVALDAKTGKVVWTVANGDPKKGETGTSAPMVVKDKVIVGISGGEFGVQCHVTAYDTKDGKQVWRAYSVGPDDQLKFDPEKTMVLGKPVGKDSSLKTWQGDQWKIGGGCTWGWLAYDPALDLFYYGSGNPSNWNPKQRPGDNKWSMTIFARSPDTGMAKWVYQMTPHDEWEYDGVNEMILADIPVGGKETKALVHFDRNGLGYTLNRETGELLVAEKYDPTVNWTTGVDMDKNSHTYGRPVIASKYSTEQNGEDVNSKGICPASVGSKDQQPAAYSPETKLFYVPMNHICMDYQPFKVSYIAGQPYVGATLSMYPPGDDQHMGNFIAWDAGTGKIVWSNKEQFSVWSGALATAGRVVFYGTLEGYLKAVDAKTGKELYKFKTPSGIIGNVMTYSQRGKQYVAVLSGVGGWAGIGLAAGLTNPADGLGALGGYAGLAKYTSLGGSLTVFTLPQEY